VIDILVQKHRNAHAAKRFFRKLLKGQGSEAWQLVTDKLRSYAAAHRSVMPSVAHDTRQYANNRAEVSHQPTRQRERLMRRFKSAGQAQRFLSVHAVIQNLFRLGRHRLRSETSDCCEPAPSEPGVRLRPPEQSALMPAGPCLALFQPY
jgi:putative transposase